MCIRDSSYKTPIVQHCHIENPISCAYMENGRIIAVSYTHLEHVYLVYRRTKRYMPAAEDELLEVLEEGVELSLIHI